MIVVGSIAAKAAISYHKRAVNALYIEEGKGDNDRDVRYLIRLAAKERIPISFVDRAFLTKKSSSNTHGGVLAEVGARENDSLASLLYKEVVFCLNGIEDPFNYAYCLRSLCAFGFEGILAEERNFFDSEALILRSSAGAYDRVLLHQSAAMDESVRCFKENGYRIYALQRSATSSDLYETDFRGKVLILLGGERRGIRKSTLSLAEKEIVIPYGSDFRNALNATSALAVVAGEVFRNRRQS